MKHQFTSNRVKGFATGKGVPKLQHEPMRSSLLKKKIFITFAVQCIVSITAPPSLTPLGIFSSVSVIITVNTTHIVQSEIVLLSGHISDKSDVTSH